MLGPPEGATAEKANAVPTSRLWILHGVPMTEPILLTVFASQLAAAAMLPALAWHKIWTDALRLASPEFSHRPQTSSPGHLHASQRRNGRSAPEADTQDAAASLSVTRREGTALNATQWVSAFAAGRRGAAA